MTVSDRSAAIDAVRVVGIIFVVAAHVWGSGEFARIAFAWHVPVFFFLTGWLWKPGRSMRAEFVNRFRTIGVPYIAWALILAVVFLVRSQQPVSEVVRHLIWGGNLLQRPWYAYWFVGTLFVTCLVRRALDRLGLLLITAVALLALVLAYFCAVPLSNTPLSAGLTLVALPFVVAGELAKRLSPFVPARGYVGVAMVVASVFVVLATPMHVFNLKYGGLGTPGAAFAVAIAIAWGLVLTGQAVEHRVPNRAREAVIALGGVGLLVVLAHGLPLWLMPDKWSELIVGVVGCWAFALVIRRTPIAWVLVAFPLRTFNVSRSIESPPRSPQVSIPPAPNPASPQ